MIEIPQRLQNPEFRFIRLHKWDKKDSEGNEIGKHPTDKKWQTKSLWPFDDLMIQSHISRGFNYGVVCGHGGLVVVDIDNESLSNQIQFNTFTIKTARGRHYYFIFEHLSSNFKLFFDGKPCGEVRNINQYVVGPNSIHPSGCVYSVEKDLPIQSFDYDNLLKALKSHGINLVYAANEDKPMKIGPWLEEVNKNVSILKAAISYGFQVEGNKAKCLFCENGKINFRDEYGIFKCSSSSCFAGNLAYFVQLCKDYNFEKGEVSWLR